MTWRLPDYTEIGRLGSGATGTVVSAKHDPTGTFVAIKFLSAGRRGRSVPSDWFRGQVKLLTEIDNTNVARLYEYVEGPKGGALVSELVDGVSLSEIIARGVIEPLASLAVLRGSLRGLAAAHRKGVLHRDFRPANVQVTLAGSPKVVDFGVVPPVESMHPGAGTPLYQAPELWDRNPAGTRSDVYAAAAAFFECLTGHPPFPPAATMAEMRAAHEHGDIPLDEVPEQIRDLVARGLAKDPAERPVDAAAYLASVEQVAAQRFGSDWLRAGEAALARRISAIVPLQPRPAEVKQSRTASAVGSALATRLLVGAALVVAIIVGISAGLSAGGKSVNTASDQPEFAVVLPNGTTTGGTSTAPTGIPTLLIIPTPGVTLTAPPARTTAPGGHGTPVPIQPPPTHTTHPTGNPTGNPTTAPPTTPTTPPTETTPPPSQAAVIGAHLTDFSYDGANAIFDIVVTTDGTGPVSIGVSVTGGDAPVGTSVDKSGQTSYDIGGQLAVSLATCTTSTTILTISTNTAFDSSSVSSQITVSCPSPPTP
ncbi:MAG TPA: serine/threonine-protein kinase [Micromonosporaceae bacterium]|nr:serine/threonine-protein kinase [Micromonosporaceae bacterium]